MKKIVQICSAMYDVFPNEDKHVYDVFPNADKHSARDYGWFSAFQLNLVVDRLRLTWICKNYMGTLLTE